MKYNPAIHKRRSVRLKEYDYSQQGAYFITICCNNRTCLFGEIINGEMILNAYGNIAYNEWLKTTEIRSNVELDVFVIMPNHIHGIIIINNDRRGVLHTPGFASQTPPPILHPTDKSRGVSYTPYSVLYTPGLNNVHMSELQKPDVLYTPDINNIPVPIFNQGVCNTPVVNDIPPLFPKQGVCNTPVVNNTPLLVPNQGVCNTPLRKNIGGEMRSPSNNIGAMVRGYKSAVTKQINILDAGIYNRSSIIWQRGFHEHIIRNEKSYQNISDYIVNNPSKWNTDTFHKS